MSLPASLSNVIGVTSDKMIKSPSDYVWRMGNSVDGIFYGNVQRLSWKNKITYASGNSFACAHCTCVSYNLLEKNKCENVYELKKILKEKAVVVVNKVGNRKKDFEMTKRKIAVFPVNKEIVNLLKFPQNLLGTISKVADFRTSGKVGMNVQDIIECGEKQNNLVVENIEQLDISDIDMIVVGHIHDAIKINSCGQKICKLLLDAINKRKIVYAFENLDYLFNGRIKKASNVFWNMIVEDDVPFENMNKLYYIHQPVLGIFGTSSKQGKFTLQLNLKEELQKNNIMWGCWGLNRFQNYWDSMKNIQWAMNP